MSTIVCFRYLFVPKTKAFRKHQITQTTVILIERTSSLSGCRIGIKSYQRYRYAIDPKVGILKSIQEVILSQTCATMLQVKNMCWIVSKPPSQIRHLVESNYIPILSKLIRVGRRSMLILQVKILNLIGTYLFYLVSKLLDDNNRSSMSILRELTKNAPNRSNSYHQLSRTSV